MKHRITKYTIRESRADEVREAVLNFIGAVLEGSPEGVKIDVFVEKDGLTFYHVASFRYERVEEAHSASEQLADIWEAE